MTFRLTAPCHFGLEKTLSFEVRRIGGEDIAVSDGRVTFTGDERVLIRAKYVPVDRRACGNTSLGVQGKNI